MVLFKLFFCALGFKFWKLQGALVGFILGHAFDVGLTATFYRFRARQIYRAQVNKQANEIFFVSTFSLLAKLVKVDGVISKEEIQAVDQIMREVLSLKRRRRREAIRIFNRAKNSTASFHYHAAQFYQLFSAQPEVLRGLVEMLRRVALADGPLDPREEKLIRSVAEMFNLDAEWDSSQAASAQRTNGSNAYAVLGCKATDSVEEIKQRYRKLVSEYHPDKIIAKALPADFISFANNRFREIQEAYETIKKARAFQ